MSTLVRSVYIPQLLGGAAATAALRAPAAPLPMDRIDEVTAGVIAALSALDLHPVDEAGRRLLQNPSTADAPLVARAQVQALRLEEQAAEAAEFDGEQVQRLCDQHTALRQGAHVVSLAIDATEEAMATEQAARAAGRARIRAHVEAELQRRPEEDPERARYVAAKAQLDQAEARAAQAEGAARAREDRARAEVRAQLDATEGDLLLAEVLHQLRLGQTPDRAALLAAAARLAEREAAEAADEEAAATADKGRRTPR